MSSTPSKSTLKTELPVDLASRTTLNIGCGLKRFPEAVNLDVNRAAAPDIVHNLDRLPWPLPDSHFREVLAYDVLEHLADFMSVMDEVYRVCENGAVVRITVPHFSCANSYTDPTHRRSFGYFSIDFLTGETWYQPSSAARFKKLVASLVFYPSLVNKLVWRLANRYPERYERRWMWMFPAWYLYFELEVRKDT
jgi:hypothetical protein